MITTIIFDLGGVLIDWNPKYVFRHLIPDPERRHFFFEKNRPATFKYPFYSLLGDWVMYKDMLTGKIRL